MPESVANTPMAHHKAKAPQVAMSEFCKSWKMLSLAWTSNELLNHVAFKHKGGHWVASVLDGTWLTSANRATLQATRSPFIEARWLTIRWREERGG